jgi:hypothetical protein
MGSMTATNTVDAAATTVEATTVDTTAAPAADTTETTIVSTTTAFDADATARRMLEAGKGDVQRLSMEIAKVAVQGNHTISELSELLQVINDLEANGEFKQLTGLSDTDTKVAGKLTRHYLAGSISRGLDEQYNALRVELCDDSNGHGVYLEGGPLGHAGFGLGVVSKETKDGKTTVKRTGAGVYFRADHVMGSAVVADSRSVA